MRACCKSVFVCSANPAKAPSIQHFKNMVHINLVCLVMGVTMLDTFHNCKITMYITSIDSHYKNKLTVVASRRRSPS